ncbi:hypothetical protein [Paenibacillus flagellatus]|uniref:Glycine zipper domain-containing protein n=1 Tax=Paenibacillus flagellatus TaxID=2211139 RepID=A0A2V5KNC2_9BACL|nr:hypothetical protein [Paenibacillus flagellatus]PYI52547.1 hypothetical protein DLM86_20450 [Paenibacillus flagellatus]
MSDIASILKVSDKIVQSHKRLIEQVDKLTVALYRMEQYATRVSKVLGSIRFVAETLNVSSSITVSIPKAGEASSEKTNSSAAEKNQVDNKGLLSKMFDSLWEPIAGFASLFSFAKDVGDVGKEIKQRRGGSKPSEPSPEQPGDPSKSAKTTSTMSKSKEIVDQHGRVLRSISPAVEQTSSRVFPESQTTASPSALSEKMDMPPNNKLLPKGTEKAKGFLEKIPSFFKGKGTSLLKVGGVLGVATNVIDVVTAKDKKEATVGAVAGAGGAAIGAAIGSFILPGFGTAIGGTLGNMAGTFLGKKVYNMFSGKKTEEETSKEKAPAENTSNASSITQTTSMNLELYRADGRESAILSNTGYSMSTSVPQAAQAETAYNISVEGVQIVMPKEEIDEEALATKIGWEIVTKMKATMENQVTP